MSPSGVEQRSRGLQNTVNAEFQTQAEPGAASDPISTTIVTKKGQVDNDDQRRSLQHVNLYRYGKLQMLKQALKSQA